MNSKTHLTNDCFGIRCGENLFKVVYATGDSYKSTFTYFNFTNTFTRYQPRLNKVDRKDKVYCFDQLDEPFTIYQEYLQRMAENGYRVRLPIFYITRNIQGIACFKKLIRIVPSIGESIGAKKTSTYAKIIMSRLLAMKILNEYIRL